MSIFSIFNRKRREEERRRREAEASRAGTASIGDCGYNPVIYGQSAVSDSGPALLHACGSVSSSRSYSGLSCSGGGGD